MLAARPITPGQTQKSSLALHKRIWRQADWLSMVSDERHVVVGHLAAAALEHHHERHEELLPNAFSPSSKIDLGQIRPGLRNIILHHACLSLGLSTGLAGRRLKTPSVPDRGDENDASGNGAGTPPTPFRRGGACCRVPLLVPGKCIARGKIPQWFPL